MGGLQPPAPPGYPTDCSYFLHSNSTILGQSTLCVHARRIALPAYKPPIGLRYVKNTRTITILRPV